MTMISRVLNIGHWVVDFLFAVDRYDQEGVLACLYDVNAPLEVMRRAGEIMERGDLDCGFTFSNPDLKRAVCVVGPTSSGEEFINSFVHETRHVADAIARSIGYELDGEFPAYVSGDAAMALAEVVCELGCEHCRGVK